MKITIVAAVAAAAALAGCGGGDKRAAIGPMTAGSTQPAATTGPTTSGAAGGTSCPAGMTMVSGQANIFGAGSESAPAPGGESGGVVPSPVELTEGASVVTFPTITGTVSPMESVVGRNGPAGDRVGVTDITSYEGISGIVDRRTGMFLVGVFLADDAPSAPPPERLDFTKGEGFTTLAPEIAQTFFIGDGRGRTYRVPHGATRLFLGFADAYSDGHFYQGRPGFYGNNGGRLCVAVEAAS
jgi:hypothetical protein